MWDFANAVNIGISAKFAFFKRRVDFGPLFEYLAVEDIFIFQHFLWSGYS